MSYNYLPLDRKWLGFQQVKNLLDYDQLVSITFDAHERILKCRQYLDSNENEKQVDRNLSNDTEYNTIKSYASGIGKEVPVDIVKLMLMLKIKSLSYGQSAAQIETIKRLMEMYNTGVFPVVYTKGVSGAGGDVALSQLSLPLIGLGEVYYEGEKRVSGEVLNKLGWEPLRLVHNESLALITGTHFLSAYGLYALKKAEQLLKVADVIAALSLDAFGCSLEPFHSKIQSVRSHKGQVETAAFILNCFAGSEPGREFKLA